MVSIKSQVQIYTMNLNAIFVLQGDLLIMNPVTVEPYCGCDPLLLNQVRSPVANLITIL